MNMYMAHIIIVIMNNTTYLAHFKINAFQNYIINIETHK